MLPSPTFSVTTGAQLRQFVLDALRVRNLGDPATWRQGRNLDDYLSALWHVAQQYKDRPFQFYFIAEMLEKAFDYPPMPYDWESVLRQPYRPTSDNLALHPTPEYFVEIETYAHFERVVKRQIEQVKRIFRLPEIPPHDEWMVLDGHREYWANLFLGPFLERGTVSLEEALEAAQDTTWSYLVGILEDGRYID